jgi:SAM-dependent methyltransferase
VFRVQAAPDTIFALAPMQRLLDDEWALAMQRAMRVAAGPALSIAPLAESGRRLPESRPGSCALHVDDTELSGVTRCTPDALPWSAESFDLVIVRHAFDALPVDSGLDTEVARVLAPGGTLLLFGFNPLSPWRLWSAARLQPGMRGARSSSAARMAGSLRERGLETIDRGFLGGRWPRADTPGEAGAEGSRWEAAWMLTARKQAVAMRPIPIRAAHRRAKVVPSFVATTSRRLRA